MGLFDMFKGKQNENVETKVDVMENHNNKVEDILNDDASKGILAYGIEFLTKEYEEKSRLEQEKNEQELMKLKEERESLEKEFDSYLFKRHSELEILLAGLDSMTFEEVSRIYAGIQDEYEKVNLCMISGFGNSDLLEENVELLEVIMKKINDTMKVQETNQEEKTHLM